MYSVYLSNKGQEPLLIFDDRLPTPETALISPTLDIESGQAGSFDATLPPTNIGYSAIEAMKTEVIVKKNGKEKWRGRVLNPSTDFYNQMKIEVEGELTYLTDTYQPQHEYKTETLRQVIEGILSIHNQKVSGANEPFDKTFYVGAVFVSDAADDPTGTDKSYRATDYDTTLNCLKKIADTYKGYFIIRRGEDGKRYLDFLKEFNETCSQRIDFGENLLDFTKSFKMEDLCTVAMPIGGRVTSDVGDEMYIYRTEDGREVNYLSSADWQLRRDAADTYRGAGVVYFNEYGLHAGDKVYVSLYNRFDTAEDPKDGMWAFSGPHGIPAGPDVTHKASDSGEYEVVTEKALTIPEGTDRLRVGWYVNSEFSPRVNRQKAESGLDEHFTIKAYGDVDDENFKHTHDDIYLIYKPLYEKYGWHEKKLEFNNLEKADELWNMATYWLTHTQFEQMTLNVTAFDLSMMNASYDDIWINTNVPIYSAPHGLTNNLILPCTKMSVKLGSPDDTEYTLGYTTPTAISDTQSNVNADLSKFMEEVPTYSDTFKSIRDNSAAIINSMYSVGYVSFLHDNEHNPNTISAIVIADTDDPASATKKWVWNAGGLAYQEWNSTQSQWDTREAMTMDGWIVSEAIAAHTLMADRIGAGTLKLGDYTWTGEDGQTHGVTGAVLEAYADDGYGHNYRIAAIERDYGITSETCTNHETDYNGYFMRLKRGALIGGFTGGSSNSRNSIQEEGEYLTGRIRINQGYQTGGVTKYGIDVRGDIFGINTDAIWVSREKDGPASTGKHLMDFVVNGKRLTFWKGILVEVEDVNNGGE